MTLIERDRENVRLGEYKKTVSSIRENAGHIDDDMLMKVLQITPTIFYLVKDEISKHHDWDDEQVAEEIEWS